MDLFLNYLTHLNYIKIMNENDQLLHFMFQYLSLCACLFTGVSRLLLIWTTAQQPSIHVTGFPYEKDNTLI